MTRSGINWTDISGQSRAGINWSDVATLGMRIGAATDTAGAATVFGQIGALAGAFGGLDGNAMQALVTSLQTLDLGTMKAQIQEIANGHVNWDDIAVLSKSGVLWADINAMSRQHINWSGIDALSKSGVNWADIEGLSKAGVNWSKVAALAAAGVNWDDLTLLTNAGVNWADLSALSEAGVNWEDLAAMSTSGTNWNDLKSLTRAGMNWGGMVALSSAQMDWAAIKTLGGKANTISDIESTTAAILNTVTSIAQTVGKSNGKALTERMKSIEDLVTKVQELSTSIAKEGQDTNQKAEVLVNKLVALANDQAKDLGFIGEQLKKMGTGDASNLGLVQGKLDEIKSYLLAIKEATDASTKEKLGEGKEMPVAIVKSWLELGEEKK